MKYHKIINKLEKYNYISFDIFDTLIKRNVENPSDVFELIEEKYHLKDFKKNRIEAELISRRNSNCEINLYNIYLNMEKKYKKYNINELMKLEIETEISLCVFNREIKEIYNFCIENKKNVIITSDMYLPIYAIKKILKNNNISYSCLFVSGDIGKSKHKGDIYPYILNELAIDNNKLIHIGDNFKSDYINPRKNGIKSILFRNKIKDLRHFKNINGIDENLLKQFIINNNTSSIYFYNIGYTIMGPLLFSFCNWLHENLKKNNIKTLLFLSRDGLIIKKAYEKIYGESCENYYFYASRRALIVPSLKYYNNIEEMLRTMFLEDKIEIKKIINNLGLDLNYEVNENIKKFKIDIYKKVCLNKLKCRTSKEYLFLESLYKMIVKESELENNALVKYIMSIKNNRKIGIVDIGWFGNMQNSLEKIIKNENLDISLYGFYVGLNPQNKYQNRYNMMGFLFDKVNNYTEFEYERRYNSIFETMFTATHPSLKKYVIKNKKIGFVFKKSDNSDKCHEIEYLQNGALKFVKEINDFSKKINIEWEKINILKFINDFGCNPTLQDAIKWGNLKFDSGSTTNYIAKPIQNLSDYLNIKNLIKNFMSSYWKIGYLKRIFKLKINYNKLYDILKKGK